MKIEEGKFYMDALGRKVGPMIKVAGREYFSAGNTGYHYHKNGRSGYLGVPDDTRKALHLIAKWTDPVETADPIDPAERINQIAAALQDDSDSLSPIRNDRTVPVFVREGYDSLFTVLTKALHQAQEGKGRERHAQPDQRFEDQPIMAIGQLVGIGFQTGQAIKKAVEAQGMIRRGDFVAAEREMLGAVNYLAAAVLTINRMAS